MVPSKESGCYPLPARRRARSASIIDGIMPNHENMKPTTFELIGATLVIVPVAATILAGLGIVIYQKLKDWRSWWKDAAGVSALLGSIAIIIWAVCVLVRYLES